MRVVVASNEQLHLVSYLEAAGHDVKELYVNDLAVQVCREFQADVILYFEDLTDIKPHEDVLKELMGYTRVVLVAQKDSSLISYAAALGVKDFVILPTEPAVILERLKHPATSETAAAMLRELQSKVSRNEGSEDCGIQKGILGFLKQRFFKKNKSVNRDAKKQVEYQQELKVESASTPEDDSGKKDDPESVKKVLLLGRDTAMAELSSILLKRGIEIASDHLEAVLVIADIYSFQFAPLDKPLIVLGTGSISDFAIKQIRRDAHIVTAREELLKCLGLYTNFPGRQLPIGFQTKSQDCQDPLPKRGSLSLKVLPGGCSTKGCTLAFNSALYVVCPARPGLAGKVAVQLAKNIDNCALVCAAPESMGALALGIPEEDLICADWRVPGSDAPIKWEGIMVWPIDPLKFLNIKESSHALVSQIKPKFSLVVVDCAGNLEIVSRAPKTDGTIVIHKDGDTADAATSYWLKHYAGGNILVMSPPEVPDILSAENGFIDYRPENLPPCGAG